MATVKADGSNGRIKSRRKAGISIVGKPCGIPPNVDPMVSTGSPKTATARVPPNSEAIEPGSFGRNLGTMRITPREAAARLKEVKSSVRRFAPMASIRAKNSLGFPLIFSPRKSLIWVEAISRAIPLVKPMTMGRGINLTAVPKPVKPRNSKITPAIIVTISKPESPCRAMIPATITTKAPVGPPI
jgi:hypothetical protein